MFGENCTHKHAVTILLHADVRRTLQESIIDTVLRRSTPASLCRFSISSTRPILPDAAFASFDLSLVTGLMHNVIAAYKTDYNILRLLPNIAVLLPLSFNDSTKKTPFVFSQRTCLAASRTNIDAAECDTPGHSSRIRFSMVRFCNRSHNLGRRRHQPKET